MLFLEATELLLRLVKLFLDIIVVALQATRLPLRLLQTAVQLFDTLIWSLESLTQSLDLFEAISCASGEGVPTPSLGFAGRTLSLRIAPRLPNTDSNKCFCHILSLFH